MNQVSRTLRKTGLEGRCLRLELTETVAMEEPKRTAIILNGLRRLGVRFSIDDFGTGYSSLNYLHRFPLDTLKIDRYFVSTMSTDERNQNIVKTMVSLAHSLNMEVVAEGAETVEQIDLLRSIQCNYVQGHFYYPAMDAASTEALLEKQCAWQDVAS